MYKKRKGVVKIKGYIVAVMCVTVIGSIISMLAPDGEGGGIGKHIRLIYGLCVVIVCINPIKDIVYYINELDIGGIVDLPEQESDRYADIFDDAYGTAEVENLKSGIKQILLDRFGIDNAECEIAINLTEKSELSRIIVTLYGGAVWKNTNEIESLLGDLFGCEIVTVIE